MGQFAISAAGVVLTEGTDFAPLHARCEYAILALRGVQKRQYTCAYIVLMFSIETPAHIIVVRCVIDVSALCRCQEKESAAVHTGTKTQSGFNLCSAIAKFNSNDIPHVDPEHRLCCIS